MHVSFNIDKHHVHLYLQSPVFSVKLVHLFLLLFLHVLLSCNVYPATDIRSVISIVSICLSCWGGIRSNSHTILKMILEHCF